MRIRHKLRPERFFDIIIGATDSERDLYNGILAYIEIRVQRKDTFFEIEHKSNKWYLTNPRMVELDFVGKLGLFEGKIKFANKVEAQRMGEHWVDLWVKYHNQIYQNQQQQL
jgi:hypothetical protein